MSRIFTSDENDAEEAYYSPTEATRPREELDEAISEAHFYAKNSFYGKFGGPRLSGLAGLESRLGACPCCGGVAEFTCYMTDHWKATCLKCGMSTRGLTSPILALEWWNRRV